MQADKAKWTDMAIVVLTVGIVLVSAMQWHKMHTGSADTHDLAVAAKAQADAARVQAENTKTIAESAKSQALNTQNLAQSTSDEVHRLDASVREAHRLVVASEIANKNFKDADRPWIGAYMSMQDFEVGKSPVLTITVANTGRRPARITLTEVRAKDYEAFPARPEYPAGASEWQSVTLVVPNQSANTVLTIATLTQQHMDLLMAGRDHYYVHANIEYLDVLTHTTHWTHVCWRYFPGLKNSNSGFVNCDQYNEAN